MSVVSSLVVEISSDISGLTRGINNADRQIDGFVTRTGHGMMRFGAGLTAAVSVPLLGIGVAATRTAIEWETAFTGVEKTVDASTEQLDLLEDQLRDMATDATNPVAGLENAHVTLAKIAELAGSLGVETENIDEFTQTIAQLDMTSDLTAESAATMAAQFANITGMDVGENIDEFASAVVDLGNKLATTEPQLLEFAQRLAGAGENAGLSEAEILAFSGALASLGLDPEAGGTAFSQTMNTIVTAAARGGEELGVLAEAAGTTADAFQNNWANDPAATFVDFLEGLGAMSPADRIATLDALGLSGVRVSDTLTRMAGNTALVTDALTIANDAWEENTALTQEAETRFATTEAQMNLLENNLYDLAIGLGTVLLPPLNDVISALVPFIQDLADTNPELLQLAVGIGVFGAAIGPVVAVLGGIVTLGGLIAAPIGIAAAAIGGLAYVISNDIGGARTQLEEFITGLQNVDVSGIQTNITDGISNLDFSGIQTTIETHFNDILGTVVSVAGIVFGGPVGLAIGAASLVSSAIENDFLGIGTYLDESGISTAVNEALSNVQDTINNIISSVFGGAQQGPQAQPLDITGSLLPDGEAGMSGPLGLFVSDLQRGFTALQGVADNVVANILPGLTSLGDGVKGFIDNLAGTETDGLLRVVTAVVGFVGGIAAKGVELGSDALGNLLSDVGATLPAIGSFINDFVSSISDMGEGNWGEAAVNLADSLIDIGQAALNFTGIDIQIPDFSTALAGWQTFADSVGIIINAGLNNVAVGFRTVGRDIEEIINRFQVAAADAQMALGINWDANAATRETALGSIQGIESAEMLEQQIKDSMAAGNVSIDMSEFVTTDPALIAAKIADPLLIQEALNAALAEGDTATFDVLAPVAMELGIDPQTIIDQYQAELDAAAAAATPSVDITADITVLPGSIDMSAVESAIGASGTVQPATVGATPVPGLDTGGYIANEGLAYLHDDEVVLNPAQTQDYMRGGRGTGGSSPTQVNIYAQSVDQILAELTRRGVRVA